MFFEFLHKKKNPNKKPNQAKQPSCEGNNYQSTSLTFGGFTLSHQESPPPVFQTQQQPLRVSASDFAKVPPGEVGRENTGHTRQGWLRGKKKVHVGWKTRKHKAGVSRCGNVACWKLRMLHARGATAAYLDSKVSLR